MGEARSPRQKASSTRNGVSGRALSLCGLRKCCDLPFCISPHLGTRKRSKEECDENERIGLHSRCGSFPGEHGTLRVSGRAILILRGSAGGVGGTAIFRTVTYL